MSLFSGSNSDTLIYSLPHESGATGEAGGVFLPNGYFGLGFGDKTMCRHAFDQENIPPDDGVVSEDGLAAEHGGIGVDDDVVFNRRMALNVFDGIAVFVEWEAFRPEGDALIMPRSSRFHR